MPRFAIILATVLAVACATSVAPVRAPAPAAAAADPGAALPPYPALGSDEAKADLAIMLWLQRTRTPADVARAMAEDVIGLETFAAALGPGFDAATYPQTRALLDRFHEEARAPLRAAKDRFRRPRPYVADARITPVVERERSSSYPSGHATRGVLVARVLAELAPDRRSQLLEQGRRVGYSRVVGGVHYPSDVLAGQQLGEALADRLLAVPELRRELERVRAAEWSVRPAVAPR